MSGRCGEPKPKTTKPSNPNLRRKRRGRPSWKQEAGGCVVPVTRNSERRTEIAGSLSTGIGRTAWKQAERKKRGSGTKETEPHRRNRRQGRSGRGEKKDGRLSSQKQAEANERERKAGGKARKRSESGKEGKHRWNSCGSEAG